MKHGILKTEIKATAQSIDRTQRYLKRATELHEWEMMNVFSDLLRLREEYLNGLNQTLLGYELRDAEDGED